MQTAVHFICIHFPMYRSAAVSALMQDAISRVNVFSKQIHIQEWDLFRNADGVTPSCALNCLAKCA